MIDNVYCDARLVLTIQNFSKRKYIAG